MPARRPSTSHRSATGLPRTARRVALLLLSGLCLAITPVNTGSAQQAPPLHSSAGDPHAAHIVEAARRFDIPERWIRAVLHAESAGDVRAISSVGAIGLMQVIPDTWAALRTRYQLGRDPYLPRDNILAGTAYLREMYDRYGGITAMLAAYNAGPGRYDEFRTTGRPLPAETRAYVAKLAPVLGGAPLPQRADRASERPPDWRHAPIFVARSSNQRNNVDPSARQQPGGIFLVRNDTGDSS